jgi:hypothetical protein
MIPLRINHEHFNKRTLLLLGNALWESAADMVNNSGEQFVLQIPTKPQQNLLLTVAEGTVPL